MPERIQLPPRRFGIAVDFEHDGHNFTGGAGLHENGRIGDVFLHTSKTGQHLQIFMRDAAIAASFALQHGADFNKLRASMLRNEDGTAAGPLGHLFDILAGETKA
jgi:hypothetical protein